MKNFHFFLMTIFAVFISDFALAKNKKKHIAMELRVPQEYVLQADLSQSECEKMVIGDECFRRDHMRDEPYYHQSRVVIFNGKIFAEQFFENHEKSKNMLLLKVRDGSYKLLSNNGNLISFDVKDGAASNLRLTSGSLEGEKKLESKCDLAEIVYGFYSAYDKTQIIEKSAFFKDEYNFDGLKEVIFFVEKSNQEQVLVLLRNSTRDLDAIRDLRICKMPGEDSYFLRHFSNDECQKDRNDTIADECVKYSACEDYMVVKNCDIVLLKDAMN